jgi:hypothetical protein
MPINDKQKIAIVDNAAGTLADINAKLQQGYVIQHIINLAPVFNKLLIVYSTPDQI